MRRLVNNSHCMARVTSRVEICRSRTGHCDLLMASSSKFSQVPYFTVLLGTVDGCPQALPAPGQDCAACSCCQLRTMPPELFTDIYPARDFFRWRDALKDGLVSLDMAAKRLDEWEGPRSFSLWDRDEMAVMFVFAEVCASRISTVASPRRLNAYYRKTAFLFPFWCAWRGVLGGTALL